MTARFVSACSALGFSRTRRDSVCRDGADSSPVAGRRSRRQRQQFADGSRSRPTFVCCARRPDGPEQSAADDVCRASRSSSSSTTWPGKRRGRSPPSAARTSATWPSRTRSSSSTTALQWRSKRPGFRRRTAGSCPPAWRAPASVSPARALNIGVELARGDLVCIVVDGARMASPGLLRHALAAATLQRGAIRRHAGVAPRSRRATDVRSRPATTGAVEDDLLAGIGWPADGYRLFEVSTPAPSSRRGYLAPLPGEQRDACCRSGLPTARRLRRAIRPAGRRARRLRLLPSCRAGARGRPGRAGRRGHVPPAARRRRPTGRTPSCRRAYRADPRSRLRAAALPSGALRPTDAGRRLSSSDARRCSRARLARQSVERRLPCGRRLRSSARPARTRCRSGPGRGAAGPPTSSRVGWRCRRSTPSFHFVPRRAGVHARGLLLTGDGGPPRAARHSTCPVATFCVPEAERNGPRPNSVLNQYVPPVMLHELRRARADSTVESDRCLVDVGDDTVVDMQLLASSPVYVDARPRAPTRGRGAVPAGVRQRRRDRDARPDRDVVGRRRRAVLQPDADRRRCSTPTPDRFFFRPLTLRRDRRRRGRDCASCSSPDGSTASSSPSRRWRSAGRGASATRSPATSTRSRCCASPPSWSPADFAGVDYFPSYDIVALSDRSVAYSSRPDARTRARGRRDRRQDGRRLRSLNRWGAPVLSFTFGPKGPILKDRTLETGLFEHRARYAVGSRRKTPAT